MEVKELPQVPVLTLHLVWDRISYSSLCRTDEMVWILWTQLCLPCLQRSIEIITSLYYNFMSVLGIWIQAFLFSKSVTYWDFSPAINQGLTPLTPHIHWPLHLLQPFSGFLRYASPCHSLTVVRENISASLFFFWSMQQNCLLLPPHCLGPGSTSSGIKLGFAGCNCCGKVRERSGQASENCYPDIVSLMHKNIQDTKRMTGQILYKSTLSVYDIHHYISCELALLNENVSSGLCKHTL